MYLMSKTTLISNLFCCGHVLLKPEVHTSTRCEMASNICLLHFLKFLEGNVLVVDGKELSNLEQSQLVVTVSKHLWSAKAFKLLLLSSSERLLTVVSGWINYKPVTGCCVLTYSRGQQGLSCLVQTDERAAVVEITNIFDAGYRRKVSEHTVHRPLLRIRLTSQRAHANLYLPLNATTMDKSIRTDLNLQNTEHISKIWFHQIKRCKTDVCFPTRSPFAVFASHLWA